MALPILDGNQTATTLSTVLTSGEHIPAHTVVSLGSVAISNITSAVSGSVVSVSNFPSTQTIAGTVTANSILVLEQPVYEHTGTGADRCILIGTANADGGQVLHTSPDNPMPISGSISGTVTANDGNWVLLASRNWYEDQSNWYIDVSQYASIKLTTDGGFDGQISGGDWTYMDGSFCASPVQWDGNPSVSSIFLQDCMGALFSNTKTSYIYFTNVVTPSASAFSYLYGKKTKINDSLTNAQLRASPVGISGTVTANVQDSSLSTALDYYASNFNEPLPCRVFNLDGAVYSANPLAISGTVTVGNSVTIGSLPAISGTVTANSTAQKYFSISAVTANRSIIGYSSSNGDQFTEWNGSVDSQIVINGSYWSNINPAPVSVGNSVTIGSLPAISGTVTANTAYAVSVTGIAGFAAGTVTAIPVALVDRGVYGGNLLGYNGTNTYLNTAIESVGGNSLRAGGTFPVSGSVTIGSLPVISGTVTANAPLATVVALSNFTSTTASSVLVSANSSRKILTVFNEGSGNLHISGGSTSTTLAYQVRLSAGDYWECQPSQTTLTHSAQFASSGTARVVEIS